MTNRLNFPEEARRSEPHRDVGSRWERTWERTSPPAALRPQVFGLISRLTSSERSTSLPTASQRLSSVRSLDRFNTCSCFSATGVQKHFEHRSVRSVGVTKNRFRARKFLWIAASCGKIDILQNKLCAILTKQTLKHQTNLKQTFIPFIPTHCQNPIKNGKSPETSSHVKRKHGGATSSRSKNMFKIKMKK